MNPSARHQARHYALQAIYQWLLTGENAREIEQQFISHQITKNTDLDYFKELIHNVTAQQESLDTHFKPFLKRPLEELDPIELAILRISTYELVNRIDIPYRVVLNEALELTKRFGSVEGYKFVNGVLDQVAHRVREVEILANPKNKKG